MNKTQSTIGKQIKKGGITSSPATPLFLFGRRNYMILIGGIVLMAFGFLIMRGGQQPPEQWDPKVIYGFTRITVSTIIVTLGLLVVLYSIFAKHGSEK